MFRGLNELVGDENEEQTILDLYVRAIINKEEVDFQESGLGCTM